MATIGLSKPFYAKYAASEGTVTYSAGGVLGAAIELSLSLDSSNSNSLYADNAVKESVKNFAGGTVTVKIDDFYPASLGAVLGVTPTSSTTPSGTVMTFGASQIVPYVGFGSVVKHMQSGAYKYEAIIFPKVQFSTPGFSATTQGDEIDWQTPEIEGTVMRDDTENQNWMIRGTFDTEADAVSYIKGYLSIT